MLQLGEQLAFGNLVARLDECLFEDSVDVDIDRLRVAGLHFERAVHVRRQRHETDADDRGDDYGERARRLEGSSLCLTSRAL